MDAALNMLRKQYKAHLEWFRSDKICILDTTLGNIWNMRYHDFVDFPANEDVTGRKLPGGSWDYYTGQIPEYEKIEKTWGTEVEDIYSPLNVKKDHWVALWISLPKRHIVVWDSICTYASDEHIEEKVKPIAMMLPYLIHISCAAEDRYKWPIAPFTYERVAKVPQNKQDGDCGVYTLKYIECHALGYPFSSVALCDAKIKRIRDKLRAEIFMETEFRGTDPSTYKDLDLYD